MCSVKVRLLRPARQMKCGPMNEFWMLILEEYEKCTEVLVRCGFGAEVCVSESLRGYNRPKRML